MRANPRKETFRPQGEMFRSSALGDIYDSTTYQPRKSVGYLLSRVRMRC